MPQGRRKVPFSGKAKKAQLQMKKEKKTLEVEDKDSAKFFEPSRDVMVVQMKDCEKKSDDKSSVLIDVDLQGLSTSNRYQLIFNKESKAELAASRERARNPIVPATDPSAICIDIDKFYPASTDFPRRPDWDRTMSKDAVEANEARYFRKYVSDLMSANENLSYFELNLETWRQLWRVIEMSDILLVIVDIRCPMFPPSLYNFVNCDDRKKDMILVLNKVDLIPAGLALAWREYFQTKFPTLRVVLFSSCPSYNLREGLNSRSGLKFRKLRGRISMVTEGARLVFEECQKIAKSSENLCSIDLDSWCRKIASAGCDIDVSSLSQEVGASVAEASDRVLTLGTIGHPNVGKSSLINSLMGKRVVSVSKTPGHTKHFQTIFLSPTVKLCDCPGLVFPSLMPKPLQVLQGSYPISQVREPMSVVLFLTERVNLPRLLLLTHPDGDTKEWSAFNVCEAWALKRGYTTARTNRPDIFRAANHILRMALEGKITLQFTPPGYDEDSWNGHPDLEQINNLLGLGEPLGEGVGEEADDHDDFREFSDDDDELKSDDDTVEAIDPVGTSSNKFSLLSEED